MFEKIENLTTRLVIIRLNSGQTLFIDPGATSGEIPEVELRNNSKIKKLRDRGVIALHPAKRQLTKRPNKENPEPGMEIKKPEPEVKEKK
ncbi:MAG: hypothetical protein KAT34_17940 [Candidatus Aminicenantes bacterium]|nr:hypothetical protein [Candidatus Aminicenantes bacterium]